MSETNPSSTGTLLAQPASHCGTTQLGAPTWARPFTSIGIVSEAVANPFLVARFESEENPAAVHWRLLGSAQAPAAASERAKSRAAAIVGRTLVHEINGKIMGIGCLVGEGMRNGLLHAIEVPDQRLLDDALEQLRFCSQFSALGLKAPAQGPAAITPGHLAVFLQKTAILAGSGIRPPEVTLRLAGGSLQQWVVHSAIFWVSATAAILEDLSLPSSRMRIEVTSGEHSPDDEISFQAFHENLPTCLAGAPAGVSPSGAMADWMTCLAASGERVQIHADRVCWTVSAPQAKPPPLQTLRVGGSEPSLENGCLTLPEDTEREALLAAIARHIDSLQRVIWAAEARREDANLVERVCLASFIQFRARI